MNGTRETTKLTTIKRHNIFIVGLSVIIAAGFWIVPLVRYKTPVFSYKIFKTNNGYGYDILVNDTLQIHQDFVPVIAEKKGFSQPAQAEQAAKLVIQKLQSGENPAISRAELETICCANK
jgi:hypothetical protein